MNKVIPPGVVLLVFALAGLSQTPVPEISFESVWEPAAGAVAAARQACARFTPPDLIPCFAKAMAKAGASPEAVAFAKANEGAYIRAFQETGLVDIAAIARPFRANEIDGLLLVNGSPPQVDVDDLGKLPAADMKRDADFAGQLRQHPKAMLLPGDRSGPDVVEMEPFDSGGQRFLVDYRVADGCRACATLGRARFAFEFDSRGRLQAVRFAGFSLPESGDRERDKVQRDLLFSRGATAYAWWTGRVPREKRRTRPATDC